tara:strand:+ start:1033 stop:1269 length:237 start_codon:yes stop_codon:yes gene_type:complete
MRWSAKSFAAALGSDTPALIFATAALYASTAGDSVNVKFALTGAASTGASTGAASKGGASKGGEGSGIVGKDSGVLKL